MQITNINLGKYGILAVNNDGIFVTIYKRNFGQLFLNHSQRALMALEIAKCQNEVWDK